MIAKALSHEPEILFLDEPTAGVDVELRRDMWNLVRGLRARGVTIILTTHYIEEAERLCDEICIVQAGKIVARDSPTKLVERYGGDACIDFLARGFSPDSALEAFGAWTRIGERWSVRVHGEAGRALAAIVTHATEIGVDIDDLDLQRPNLETAFLAITGELLDEERASAA